MNIEEIKNILPHRNSMLLIEEAECPEEGKAIGKYTIKGDEYFLDGHFPGNPIVPGVILCEMTAQSACVMFSSDIKGKTPMFAGMNNVKFKNPVHPGDTVEFHTELVRSVKPFYFIKGQAFVNGKLCMSGEFSFAKV